MYAENELAIGYVLAVVGVLLLLAPTLNRMLDRYAPDASMKTGTQLAQQSIDVHSPGRLLFRPKSAFARKAASWLIVALGVLVGLLALSLSGQRWIPNRASDPYWYKSCIQTAGICLLGMTFIVGSLLGTRNRRRGGLVFLICTPFVAFCIGYPDAGFLAWEKGDGIFYSPFLRIALGLTLLFFVPFVVPLFAIRNKKRAMYLFLISAALVSPVFVRSQWSASLLPRLAGWSALLVAFGLFWLGTKKWGWPPLLAPRPTSRRSRLGNVFATCAVVVILDVAATVAMTAWQSSLWGPDCSGRALFTKPAFPGHAVFTARLIYVGHKNTDRLGWQAGDWAIGIVQDRFWGLPRWNSHLVLLTHAIFWEGETYFIDGRRAEGLLTRLLPIVEAGPCARSRPIVDATIDLRALHETLPASGACIIGYVRKPEPFTQGLTPPSPHTPFVGAKITATSPSGKIVAVADQEGIYEIDSLPPDDYTLTVDLPETQSAPVRKPKKEDFLHSKLIEQDFQVSWDGRIEGTIRDAAGEPAQTWLLLLNPDGTDTIPRVAGFQRTDSSGAGAYPDHEPTASGGAQRGPTLQEEAVAGSGTGATGGVPVSTVGEPATTRSAGVAGPTESDDRRTKSSNRAGTGKMSCSTAVEDASRSWFADGVGFCADHRNGGTVSVWQAGGELSGTGAVGGFERESATAGTYHETRQLSIALLAGGSGASDGAQPSGMAQ